MVFPTPVGVFPVIVLPLSKVASLPHARGGVSNSSAKTSRINSSSPRPWGCFQTGTGVLCLVYVFPTPVGVFPHPVYPAAKPYRLPHARGGVSSSHCLSL